MVQRWYCQVDRKQDGGGGVLKRGADMSEKEYREWGRDVADDLRSAADNGASVDELMDILDDSCFDGDICEFL